jgi:hypothetical protein
VQTYPNHEALGVVAFDEQQLELMDKYAHELELKMRTHIIIWIDLEPKIYIHAQNKDEQKKKTIVPFGMRWDIFSTKCIFDI